MATIQETVWVRLQLTPDSLDPKGLDPVSVVQSDLVFYGSLGIPAYDGSSTLASAITNSQTTISYTLTNVNSGFVPVGGVPYEFPILIGSEILWVTQGSSGSASGIFTAIRGFANTTAASAVSGTAITMLAGGPVDFLTRLSFSDTSSATGDFADTVSSSGSDVAIISLTGRDPTGVIHNGLTATLNGSTPVTGIGGQLWERYLVAQVGPLTTLSAAVTSATQVTFTTATGTTQTQPFYAQFAKEVVQVTAGATGTSWTVTRGQLGSTATLHNSGDRVFVMPHGDVAIYQHTALATGTARGASGSTGTTPALIQLASGQGSTAAVGTVLRITTGPGASGIRYIIDNTTYGTDVVAVNYNWTTTPTTGTTYSLLNGLVLESLTSNGSGATVPNQVTNIQRIFWNDSADTPSGAQRTYYQKGFTVNNNTTTSLTTVSVELASNTPSLPGSALLDLGPGVTVAGTGIVVNRQTAPSGVTFTTQPAFINVPGSGNLNSGAAPNTSGAQGWWLRLTLPAGTAPYKGATDVRVQGTTT